MGARHTPTRDAAQPLAPRDRLGRYEIVCLLAVGGMAELYLARIRGAERFEKLVAIKRIRAELANEGDLVRMFFDEARLAARLQHPNIAQVFDVGTADRCHFIAMELVEGEDLRGLKQAANAAGVLLPRDQVVNIGIQVAAALHYAHERRDADGRPLSIVHRDVSPSNIIVSYDGCVKLVDFGIAKAATNSAVTRDGHLRGKFLYMSPEQCAGDKLDRRSDMFSLGLVLYELLTGARPFDADNEVAIAHQLMTRDVPSLSSRTAERLPPALEATVMRALSRERAQRYDTALELQRELERVLRELGSFPSAADLGRLVRELCGERQLSELARANQTAGGMTAVAPTETTLMAAAGETPEPLPGRARERKPLGMSAVIAAVGVCVGALGVFVAARGTSAAGQESPEPAAAVSDQSTTTPRATAVPAAEVTPAVSETATVISPGTAPTAAVAATAAPRAPAKPPAVRRGAAATAAPAPAPTADPDAPFPGGTWKPAATGNPSPATHAAKQ